MQPNQTKTGVSKQLNPYNPQAWVECSECSTAWVLRRGMSLSQGWIWIWQSDCKHRKADPRLVGPAVEEGKAAK